MRQGDSTVIVGASAAGLAVARCLEEKGLSAVVLEQDTQVAAAWRRHYDRLHLHTTRDASALPYEPMPASFPRYPGRIQVIDYLERYAARLKTQPRFNETVTAIEPAENGLWQTRTPGQTFVSNNVVVATGHTKVPFRPTFPGLEWFGGPVIHSSTYRTGKPYEHQSVLVIGFGNSAAEIAIDLHEHGASPTLAVRGAVNVIPRDILGIPTQSLGLVQRMFSPAIADIINAPVIRATIGDIRKHGFEKLPYGPTTQIKVHHSIPVLDIGTMALIRRGAIKVRPGVSAFTAIGAVFADGTHGAFDAVILATGYRSGLEAMVAVPGVLDEHGEPVISGGPTVAAGLYFCGYTVTVGGTLKQIGVESRAIAELIAAEAAAMPSTA
jgi:cation diffusion facilitator CzcD-associated flavoprotein CzcO